MKLEKVLITGGCGFLGQHVVKELLNEFSELKIKIVDLKPNPKPVFEFNNNQNVEVRLGIDVCDYETLEKELKDVDVVIHLAGIISFSLKDKEIMEKVNVQGTQNVLKVVQKNRIKLFLHISSVAALGYGNDKDNPVDETFEFDWRIAKSKKKHYMLTKHLADLEVERARKAGLNAVILYPGLMYGPGDFTNSSRLIKAIKEKKIPFNMPGGTNVVDVRDVAKGIVKALKKDELKGNFLLSGHNLTFKDINSIIANESGVKPPSITLPRFLNPILFSIMLSNEMLSKEKIELTADNVDSAFKFRYFNNTKAQDMLGWQPEIPFEQTIQDTIKCMEKNGHFKK